MAYTIERRIRTDLPQVGYAPYRQVHAHSTGNRASSVQNEADYFHNKDINSGFYTHVVGNGRVIQVGEVNRGAWDVGGGWNAEGYASVELIESHKTKDEFMKDYKIYCELLKDLANQAGIPITVDTGDLAGIKTHNYCTYNQPNNGSDHTDPLPYLTKWGITMDQFRKDVTGASSGSGSTAPTQPNTNTELEDDELMKFTYTNGDGTVYYFNGEKVIALSHGDQLKIINQVYKETTGKDLKRYTWSAKEPWYVRFMQANGIDKPIIAKK